MVDSIRASQIDLKGPYYPDSSPVAIWGGLGLPSSATTALTATTKHTFQLQDIPATYTLFRHLDAKSYYIPYSSMAKFSLHFTADGKLLELDSTWQGLFAVINGAPPTPVYTTVLPIAGYAPTLKFSDNIVSQDVTDFQLDYAQQLLLFYPANGVADFVTVYFGERTIDLTLSARFDTDTLYQRFRVSNIIDALTFDIQGPLVANFNVSLGSPSAGNFTLTFNAQTTAGIAFNATAAAVQAALALLTTVPANSMIVTGGVGGPYGIQLTGMLAGSALALTGSGVGLTGGTFAVNAGTLFNELNIVLPTVSWDSMEHDTTKTNVMIKAVGKAIVPGGGSSLITGFVQNAIPSYTT